MAVSINLLDFYTALFERSCDAVNALASALSSFYTRRGFIMLNTKVSKQTRRVCLTDSLYRGSLSQMRSVEDLDTQFSGMITCESGWTNK